LARLGILRKLKQLTKLNLGGNPGITDEGAENLAEYFLGKYLSTLGEIQFDDWGDKANAKSLSGFLAKNAIGILTNNHLHDDIHLQVFNAMSVKLYAYWQEHNEGGTGHATTEESELLGAEPSGLEAAEREPLGAEPSGLEAEDAGF